MKVLGAATLGAVVGSFLAGLWWTARDRTFVCLGGCSPSDKSLPPGDLTLAAGALAGAVLAVTVVLLVVRLRQHRSVMIPSHPNCGNWHYLCRSR